VWVGQELKQCGWVVVVAGSARRPPAPRLETYSEEVASKQSENSETKRHLNVQLVSYLHEEAVVNV